MKRLSWLHSPEVLMLVAICAVLYGMVVVSPH
jgi:hypothetical protein